MIDDVWCFSMEFHMFGGLGFEIPPIVDFVGGSNAIGATNRFGRGGESLLSIFIFNVKMCYIIQPLVNMKI